MFSIVGISPLGSRNCPKENDLEELRKMAIPMLVFMYSDGWTCVAVILIIFSITWLLRILNKDRYADIPGPPGWPIIGNTLDFSATSNQQALLIKWAKQYGRVFKYYVLFGGYRIHVTDPAIAKHILVTNCKNYRRQDILRKILPGFGNGLITANGRAHAVQRRHLIPFFSLANVRRFIPVFVKKTNQLIDHWTAKLAESDTKTLECDILEKLTHLSLDIIGICAFGYHFNCISGGHTEESKATDTVLRGNFDLQRRSMEEIFPVLKLIRSKCQRDFCRADKCLRTLTEKVIKQRQNAFDFSKDDSNNDILGILFGMENEKGSKLSSLDIYHQVFTFLISGHETTSLTVAWAIYLLAKHPEIQTRLRDEILTNSNSTNCEVKWEDIENLKLLDNCVKEAMRLYPVAITTDRTAIGPDMLGPYKISAGTHVMVGTGALHRDEAFWDNASSFKPSRFDQIDETKAKLLQYQFLPFSRGPRMCIGYRFAMAEIKVALAMIIKNFTFRQIDREHTSNPDALISSISTLTLKPHPRHNLVIELCH